MASVGYHLRQALGGIRTSFATAFVAAFAIGASLAACGVVLVVARSLEATIESTAADARLTIFLPRETPDAQGRTWADEVRVIAGEEAHVVFVTPDEALERLAQDLGESGEALEALAINPLPPSLEVRLRFEPGERIGPENVRRLSARIGELPFASDVDWGEGFVEGLERLLHALRLGLAVGGGFVLGLLLFLVGNVVRLTIHARRDEIGILRLVGATDGFVLAPFVIEGALQGGVGGGLAALLTTLAQEALFPFLVSLFGIEGAPVVTVPLGAGVLFFPLVGAFLGAMGSLWASWRYLRAAA